MAVKISLHVLFYNDCSIRVCQLFIAIFKIPIMLASLCLMLSVTYYTQNYAGIIDWPWSLVVMGSRNTSHRPRQA